jgi:hypothetical protein
VSGETKTEIHLVRTGENVDEIDAASQRLGRGVGLSGVLSDLNRRAARARVPGLAVEWGFTWDHTDQRSERWWPQGITTSADASDTEVVDGRRLLVTSWYSHKVGGQNHGSRISVIDLDSLEYRHVLLVVPQQRPGGGVELKPLLVHAGGLAWAGPYLHVAGTRSGLFTCRIDDIIRLDTTEDTFGHRYVLPVRFAYQAHTHEGVEKMRYSFLSLDRSSPQPHLLAGEYGRGQMTRRLARFPLDPETYHLSAGDDGSSRPVWLDQRGVGHMQGAVVVRDRYYVTVSRGRHLLGKVYAGQPGAFHGFRWTVPVGPEDLAYWPSTDLLWSLTEYPHKRYVFAVRRSRFD